MIAALNTSFEAPAFAIGEQGRLFAVASAAGWPTDLTALARRAFQEAGVATEVELEGVIVATGPGRFGSLRGGVAFAKGLAMARQAPLFGAPTAAAVAETVGVQDAVVVSPAGRGRWYVAPTVESETIHLVDADEVVQAVPADVPVAGPLDADMAEALVERGRQVWRVDSEAVLMALVRLAERRLTEDRGSATLGAQPVYAAPATRARPWVRGIPQG